MKKILLAFLLLPFFSKAQMDSSKLSWSQVTVIKGTKSELFQKSKAWIYSYFTNPNGIQNDIQLMDSIAGSIILKNVNLGGAYVYNPLRGSLRIDTKDNKVKFEMYDFIILEPSLSYTTDDFGARNYYKNGAQTSYFISERMSVKRFRKKWLSDKNPIAKDCKSYNDAYLAYMQKPSNNW